jgi:hypothetical protein
VKRSYVFLAALVPLVGMVLVAVHLATTRGGTADLADGAAGVSVSRPPCAPPADPAKAALCLYLVPEKIELIPSDPDFDGQGVLGVSVYSDAAGEENTRIGEAVQLPQAAKGAAPGSPATMDISKGVPMVRIEGLPSTVYLRAIFFDSAFVPGAFRPGWWISGQDLSHGLLWSKLAPIALAAGKGTNLTLDLLAVRKLTVAISRSPFVLPVGNGQGPASSLVIDKQAADTTAKTFGVAMRGCANVASSHAAILEGFLVGEGPYWITGMLDDFGSGGVVPPGALLSYGGPADGGIMLPVANRVAYPPTAYKVTHIIELNQPIPRLPEPPQNAKDAKEAHEKREAGPADKIACP